MSDIEKRVSNLEEQEPDEENKVVVCWENPPEPEPGVQVVTWENDCEIVVRKAENDTKKET